MRETRPAKSSRRFTKRVLVVNLVLIWGLVYLAVIYGQAEFVIEPSLALIGVLFGFYTGVGHLDMRKSIELSIDRLTKGNKSYDA